MRSRQIYRWSLFVGCLLVFAAFLVWPVILTVFKGFIDPDTGGFTLEYLRLVFADPVARAGLINALIIAVSVTLVCMLIAMPLAMLSTRYDFPGKTILSALLLVPLILPPFVGAIGLRQLLGRYGAFNALFIDLGLVDPAAPFDFLGGARLGGVILMEALHLYPIVYLNVAAALANLDPTLEEAAQNLGAGRWRRFFRVTLPLILPGVFAGSTIVFIWSFTELGTPLMFDFYTVTPVQVFWGIQEMEGSPKPYALVVVMLAASALLYMISKLLLGGRSYKAVTRASVHATAKRLNFVPGLLAAGLFILVTGLAVLPHLGVVLASISEPGQWYLSVLPEGVTTTHYMGVLTDPRASESITNSLVYSSLAVVFALVFGFTVAYLVVRAKLPGAQVLDAAAMLPLAVPGLVMAFGYVAISLQIDGWFQSADAEPPGFLQVLGENPNPIVFLVIAYGVRRLPYVVRSAVAGLEQTPEELEEASMNLGASPLYTIRRVILPLILANLIAGGLLAFSFAMLEVSDSLILAQQEEHFPITARIYNLFERLGDGPYIASAMGVWGMLLLTLTLVGASLMLGKKLGAVFRI